MVRYPHHLWIKLIRIKEYDTFGRPIPQTDSSAPEWEEIDECRCEDDSAKELVSQNGQTYYSRYHVVSKHQLITEGAMVKCTDKATGEMRGEGTVSSIQRSNSFGFAEFWL